MFSNRLKNLTKSFRFRIAATYFVLVVVSSLILFGFLYFMIAQTLREKDQRIIASDYRRFLLIANDAGVEGIRLWFEQKQNSREIKDVYVRLESSSGEIVFEHDPAILHELDPVRFRRDIDAAGFGTYARSVSPYDSEDAVEFFTGRTAKGERLQVGKDTEDREDLLEEFRNAFAVTTGVALLTAILSGLFFSRSILRPIGGLIETMDAVRKGDLESRAFVRDSGDEIDELAKFLNMMLTQNSKLITALTESLDAVAHDLRTPLTRLRAHAERALAARSGEAEALGEVMENTDQLIELLDAIFDGSESQVGMLKMKPQTFAMRRFLGDVIDLYSMVAEEKSIRLQVELESDFEFECDVRMKQAVANLIDNAIKFSPYGSTVWLRAEKEGRDVLISVEDEGPGIAEIEKTKIWERLYRGDSSRSTLGMGLGLSLVRAIVIAHGGEVSVRDAHPERHPPGSRFQISVPDHR